MTLPNAHHIDLRDPALRQQHGLRQDESIDTVQKPSKWYKKPKRTYQKREEVQKAVLDVLQAAAAPMSRREIFNAIGRSKSPYLLEALAELVALGVIVQRESNYRQFLMFVYEVA